MSISYQPLDRLQSQFRLLTILKTVGVLSCTIENISLTLPPAYQALSYCWGDPKATQEILINSNIVSVGSNLVAALHQLRDHGMVKIWADALCINQLDVEERNNQLLKMGAIYRRAASTIVWLGPATDDSDQAIMRMEEVINLPIEDRLSFVSSLRLDDWKAVESIFRRDYWYRIWIIQELALSQGIIVLCGSKRTTWDVIECNLDALGYKVDLRHIRNVVQIRHDVEDDIPIHVYDALYRTQSSLASETRDKIFALLGLTYNGTAIAPMPNYAQPLSDLRLEMTLSAISMSKSLDVIALLGNSGRAQVEPTWVPNWLSSGWDSEADERRFRHLARSANVRTDMRWRPKPDFKLVGHHVLMARGIVFDTVKSLTSLWSDSSTSQSGPDFSSTKMRRSYAPPLDASHRDLAAAVQGLLDELLPSELAAGVPDQADDLDEALYPVNQFERWTPKFASWVHTNSSFAQVSIHLQPPDTSQTQRVSLFDLLSFNRIATTPPDTNYKGKDPTPLAVWNMRLMLSTCNTVAWVDGKTQVGDKIAILMGCTIPVILRSRQGGGYHVIGDSIIYEFMNGMQMQKIELDSWGYIELY